MPGGAGRLGAFVRRTRDGGRREACGARRLALVHHDPMRTDPDLDRLAAVYGGFQPGSGLEVCFAHEGLSVTL